VRQLPGLLGSGGQIGQLPPQMGFIGVQPRWNMTDGRIPTGSASQVTHLGSVLAQGSEGQCLSCSQLLPTDTSPAILSRVFCSPGCERAYISDNLNNISLKDCNRILARIDALLQSVQVQRSAKNDSGR